MTKPLILIVDDDEMNREVMSEYLELAGYAVASAHNGKTALHTAPQLQPRLILLDVSMPDISGFEVCQALHTAPATQHIPIFLVTGYNSAADRQRGLQAGAAHFLSRPFEADELFRLIEQHIRP